MATAKKRQRKSSASAPAPAPAAQKPGAADIELVRLFDSERIAGALERFAEYADELTGDADRIGTALESIADHLQQCCKTLEELRLMVRPRTAEDE